MPSLRSTQLVETYYPSGKIKTRGARVDGQWSGVYQRWFETGGLFTQSDYTDGVVNGLLQQWTEEGTLTLSATVNNGEYEGPYNSWWDTRTTQGGRHVQSWEASRTIHLVRHRRFDMEVLRLNFQVQHPAITQGAGMGKQYSHLSSEERAMMQIEIGNGASIRSIATRLGRNASTLSRELGRQVESTYSATLASQRYRRRRSNSVRRRKIIEGSALFQVIRDDLVLYHWSPQQIGAQLRSMHPDDPAQRVSHETIYASIYAHPRGGLKKELVEALRQSKPTRGRRRTTAAKRTWVPEELRIAHRPE